MTMPVISPSLVVLLVSILACSGVAKAETVAGKDGLAAQEILQRTQQVYRSSDSYTDTGRVRTEYKNSSREWTGVTRFKTAYVAPIDFRFESNMNDFQTITVEFIINSDKNGVKSWMSGDPDFLKDIATVQQALDAGAGISRDASGMIPGLFFPGSKLGGDIVRLTDAERLGDAVVE